MPKRKTPTQNIVPPALTADTAERLCEDAAYRLAQKQLEDGTALNLSGKDQLWVGLKDTFHF